MSRPREGPEAPALARAEAGDALGPGLPGDDGRDPAPDNPRGAVTANGSQVRIRSSRPAKLQVAGRFRFWRERPWRQPVAIVVMGAVLASCTACIAGPQGTGGAVIGMVRRLRGTVVG
ncbi:hypothetical protein GCM10010519_42330 [Streptomyces lactacystinicus]